MQTRRPEGGSTDQRPNGGGESTRGPPWRGDAPPLRVWAAPPQPRTWSPTPLPPPTRRRCAAPTARPSRGARGAGKSVACCVWARGRGGGGIAIRRTAPPVAARRHPPLPKRGTTVGACGLAQRQPLGCAPRGSSRRWRFAPWPRSTKREARVASIAHNSRHGKRPTVWLVVAMRSLAAAAAIMDTFCQH